MAGIYSVHDAIIGVQSALGGRGGGLRYLLRDEFTTDRAAGAVDGTAAEPGPGTRVVVDTGNALSISGGQAVFASVAGVGDPRFYYSDVVFGRVVGRLLVAVFPSVSGRFGAWFHTNGAPGNGYQAEAGWGDAIGRSSPVWNSGSTVDAMGAYVGGASLATVLRLSGAMFFAKTSGYWLLKFIAANGTQTNLIVGTSPRVSAWSGPGALRVPDALWLPTPLVSDGFGGTYGTTDGLGHAEGIAGGIGAGGGGVTLSNAGGTWSVSGGKAINTPSVGAELLTNGDFSAWTGDDPDGWTLLSVEDGSNYINESSGKAHFVQTSTIMQIHQTPPLPVPSWLKVTADLVVSSGSLIIRTGSAEIGRSFSSSGAISCVGRTLTDTDFQLRASNSSDFTVDNVSVKQLSLSELLSLSNLSCADVYAGVAITRGSAYVQAGLALNWDSASSPANGLIVYLNGSIIYVDKCVAGTWTNVSTTAFTYSAGARLVCTMNAGALRVYYNGALVTTATIADAGILTGTYHGLFSTDASNTLDDLTIYATGTGGEYSQLDSY